MLYSYSEETEDEQFPDLKTLANWPYIPWCHGTLYNSHSLTSLGSDNSQRREKAIPVPLYRRPPVASWKTSDHLNKVWAQLKLCMTNRQVHSMEYVPRLDHRQEWNYVGQHRKLKPILPSRVLGTKIVGALLEAPAPTNVGELWSLWAWSTITANLIQNLSSYINIWYS